MSDMWWVWPGAVLGAILVNGFHGLRATSKEDAEFRFGGVATSIAILATVLMVYAMTWLGTHVSVGIR